MKRFSVITLAHLNHDNLLIIITKLEGINLHYHQNLTKDIWHQEVVEEEKKSSKKAHISGIMNLLINPQSKTLHKQSTIDKMIYKMV